MMDIAVGQTVLIVWTHPKIRRAKATLGTVTGFASNAVYIDHRLYTLEKVSLHEWKRWHEDHFEIDTPKARETYGVPLEAVPLTPRPHHPNDRRLRPLNCKTL